MNLFDLHSDVQLPSGCFSEGDKPTRDEFFVFGSNLAGRHGWGAAKDAKILYGAIYGQGIGLQGRSYAIPTKDGDLNILPLVEIERRVKIFVEFTRDNPKFKFFITRLGCGLAGYKDAVIANPIKHGSNLCVLITSESTAKPRNEKLELWIVSGLAGYKDAEIAPMFNGIGDNCRIHVRWHKLVKRSKSNGEAPRATN